MGDFEATLEMDGNTLTITDNGTGKIFRVDMSSISKKEGVNEFLSKTATVNMDDPMIIKIYNSAPGNFGISTKMCTISVEDGRATAMQIGAFHKDPKKPQLQAH